MDIKTFDIKGFINGHESSNTDERKIRRKQTNEVFTPFEIVERMCEMVPEESWADPERTFLEPTFGNGNIVCYIIWKRVASGVSWKDALKTLYGIELMSDNVKECKLRVVNLLQSLGVTCGRNEIDTILDRNLVCSDFFDWDIENWCPINKESDKSVAGASIPLF